MTVRLLSTTAIALSALMFGASCGQREGAELPPETDEPLFVQGIQLKNQERKSEALASFLKVIEKRGERAAPESHLEAGTLYLQHAKDPVEAYHHFHKYIELQPNSKEAPYVRDMVDAAKRDFFRSLAGSPKQEQSVRLAVTEEMEKLRRENDELRAEIQTLRGVGAATGARQSNMIAVPDELRSRNATPPPVPIVETPVVGATPPPTSLRSPSSTQSSSPSTTAQSTPLVVPSPNRPAANTRAPGPGPTSTPAATPSRPTAPSGRTHTVQPKESMYSIAKRYNVKLEDLARANGISDPSKVPAGTVLKIP